MSGGMELHKRDTATWLAFGVLALLLGGSAFAFGAVEMWAGEWLRFGILVALGLVLWSRPAGRVFGGPVLAVLIPGAALLVWAGLQLVPLSPGILRALSPKAATAYARTVPAGGGEALPGWLLAKARAEGVTVADGAAAPKGAADAGDPLVGRTLSIYPYGTRRAILAWVTMLAFVAVAARLSRNEFSRYRLLWVTGGWSGTVALVAFLHRLSGSDKVLWLRQRPSDSRPLGPFVNPDHLGGYVVLGLMVLAGLALALASRPTGRLDRRGIRLAVLERTWIQPRLLVLGVLAGVSVVGLYLSGSRGAWLGLVSGILFLFAGKTLGKRWIATAFVGVIAVGLCAGMIGHVFPGARMTPHVSVAQDGSLALRLDAWAKTMDVVFDYPLTGTGLGTFQWAFVSYQREGEWQIWAEAHNDYLQLLSETGAVGLLLLLAFLALFISKVVLPAFDPAPAARRWTTVGVGAAIFAMLVHTSVDFNLQIPAVGALFATLVGILAAAAADRPAPAGPPEKEATS